jgi:hypothetical protein
MCAALAAALAGMSAQQLAYAEIYTWVDAKGQLNIGNLPPPDGAKVTKIVREAPPNPYNDAARDAAQKAEVEALAQRVDQLQYELQRAARQPPPQPQFVFVPAASPVVQYITEAAPAPAADCGGYGWNNCNGWWNPGFPPFASIVYVTPPFRDRAHAALGGMRGGRGDDHGRPPRRPPAKPGIAVRF